MLFMMMTNILRQKSKQNKTLFSDDIIPCINVDSVLKIDKKYYPQVYLEQYKYKVRKREIKSLIDYDLYSNYESD